MTSHLATQQAMEKEVKKRIQKQKKKKNKGQETKGRLDNVRKTSWPETSQTKARHS